MFFKNLFHFFLSPFIMTMIMKNKVGITAKCDRGECLVVEESMNDILCFVKFEHDLWIVWGILCMLDWKQGYNNLSRDTFVYRLDFNE